MVWEVPRSNIIAAFFRPNIKTFDRMQQEDRARIMTILLPMPEQRLRNTSSHLEAYYSEDKSMGIIMEKQSPLR